MSLHRFFRAAVLVAAISLSNAALGDGNKQDDNRNDSTVVAGSVVNVSEPAGIAVLGFALAGLSIVRRKRNDSGE